MAVKIIERIKNQLAFSLLKRTRIAQRENRNEKGSLFQVYVLSRSFYRETRKTYPIKNRFELYRYLKKRYPKSSNTLSFLGSETGEGRSVQHYELKDLDGLDDAKVRVMVPESLLYAEALERGEAMEVTVRHFAGQKKLFVAKLFDGSVESAEESILMPTLNRFKLGVGLMDEPDNKKKDQAISSPELIERYLLSALMHLGWQSIRTKVEQRSPINWKRLTIFSAVIFVLYNLIASTYLVISETYYQNQINSNQQQMDVLFKNQDRLSEAQTQIETLAAASNQLSDPAGAWRLLLKFDVEENAGISSINWDDETVVLSGSTSRKAADLLDILVNHQKIRSATFTQPVRKRGEKESYSIAIEIKQDGRGNDS